MLPRNGSNLQSKLGRGGQSIPPYSHRRGPGMRLLSMEGDCVAFHPLGAEHHAQRQLQGLENVPAQCSSR